MGVITYHYCFHDCLAFYRVHEQHFVYKHIEIFCPLRDIYMSVCVCAGYIESQVCIGHTMLALDIQVWMRRAGINSQWRHNGRNSVSNHQHRECLLSRLIWRRSKKKSKLCVTGLCAGNSPVPGVFPAQRATNAENGSIWWRHHVQKWICPTVLVFN